MAGLREAVAEANAVVWHHSLANPDLRGMGTTLTAVALVVTDGRDVLALANVGDSRLPVPRRPPHPAHRRPQPGRGTMRHGEMTEAEAAVHPQRHILTRALGVSADVDADMWELELRSGDRALLCSDGLTNEVGNDEMAGRSCARSYDPHRSGGATRRRRRTAHGGRQHHRRRHRRAGGGRWRRTARPGYGRSSSARPRPRRAPRQPLP